MRRPPATISRLILTVWAPRRIRSAQSPAGSSGLRTAAQHKWCIMGLMQDPGYRDPVVEALSIDVR